MRHDTTPKPSTTSARAVLGILLALAGCRTTAPAVPGPASDGAARPAAQATSSRPAPVVEYVPWSPTILVTRGEHSFVLLHATVVRATEGAPSLDIAYLASFDPAEAQAHDAQQRVTAVAAALLEAFDPLLPADIRKADVTAVYGASGTSGLALPAHVARGASGWDRAELGEARPIAIPPLSNVIGRPAGGERAAVEAARAFLEHTDARDGDGAWALASATLHATISRRTFEEILWPANAQRAHGVRREQFRLYDVHSGDFRIGDLLLVCYVSDGVVEAVQMRLDDDQEWRVADLARGIAGERPVPGANDLPPQTAAGPGLTGAAR
jgi:hypothetical protein